MKRAEIDRKFDEIVDFAEIEKFIDTPVKHYSSGMYVWLAFAVAAHRSAELTARPGAGDTAGGRGAGGEGCGVSEVWYIQTVPIRVKTLMKRGQERHAIGNRVSKATARCTPTHESGIRAGSENGYGCQVV